MKKIILITAIILIACSSVYVDAQEPSRPGWRGANLKATVGYFDTLLVDGTVAGSFSISDSLFVSTISTTPTNGNLTIDPNGSGNVTIVGLILSADWREPMREYFNDRYANLELYKIATHNQGVIN